MSKKIKISILVFISLLVAVAGTGSYLYTQQQAQAAAEKKQEAAKELRQLEKQINGYWTDGTHQLPTEEMTEKTAAGLRTKLKKLSTFSNESNDAKAVKIIDGLLQDINKIRHMNDLEKQLADCFSAAPLRKGQWEKSAIIKSTVSAEQLESLKKNVLEDKELTDAFRKIATDILTDGTKQVACWQEGNERKNQILPEGNDLVSEVRSKEELQADLVAFQGLAYPEIAKKFQDVTNLIQARIDELTRQEEIAAAEAAKAAAEAKKLKKSDSEDMRRRIYVLSKSKEDPSMTLKFTVTEGYTGTDGEKLFDIIRQNPSYGGGGTKYSATYKVTENGDAYSGRDGNFSYQGNIYQDVTDAEVAAVGEAIGPNWQEQ